MSYVISINLHSSELDYDPFMYSKTFPFPFTTLIKQQINLLFIVTIKLMYEIFNESHTDKDMKESISSHIIMHIHTPLKM